MNPTQTTLYAISPSLIARVPVVDCASRSTCYDCVVGPACGWCTLSNKCTLQSECPDNHKPLYFVAEDHMWCPAASIEESVVSMTSTKEVVS